MRTAFWAGLSLVLITSMATAQRYEDSPTSQWFKGLHSKTQFNCCDQADCKQAVSDFRTDGWWVQSNRTQEWIKVTDDMMVKDQFSIFPRAIFCEGDPFLGADGVYYARAYCFVRPPIGF